MTGRLFGKIACVTGIGAGIGQGIALMFAREGAVVIGCDINPERAAATVAQAAAEGLAIDSVHPCDLTRIDDVARYIEHAAAVGDGRIDVLVNAAAIAPHMNPVAAMDYETQWTPTMVGEVDIVFLACKAAWPHLVRSGAASIINFASVNAFRGSINFGMAAHCAGKAAVMAMTRQLAVEGGVHGVRANSIAPGMVQTAATAAAGATSEGTARTNIMNRLQIKRLGRPEDIGWCAVYLASDEASWVTGATFSIDGGVMAA
jgi:NAD(P)-dependent dehydrogenase (short-subunit alcohol dehydrogenase family)